MKGNVHSVRERMGSTDGLERGLTPYLFALRISEAYMRKLGAGQQLDIQRNQAFEQF
jgi:hypothetical protein